MIGDMLAVLVAIEISSPIAIRWICASPKRPRSAKWLRNHLAIGVWRRC